MRPVNSARVHCSQLTCQQLRAEQKKKKKKRKTQNTKCKCQINLNPNEYLVLSNVNGKTHHFNLVS